MTEREKSVPTWLHGTASLLLLPSVSKQGETCPLPPAGQRHWFRDVLPVSQKKMGLNFRRRQHSAVKEPGERGRGSASLLQGSGISLSTRTARSGLWAVRTRWLRCQGYELATSLPCRCHHPGSFFQWQRSGWVWFIFYLGEKSVFLIGQEFRKPK